MIYDNNHQQTRAIDQHQIEEQLSRELQRRKIEEENRRRERERICASSDEIKKLNQQIQVAYVTKERTIQLTEQQVRRMNEIRQESEQDALILYKREKEIYEEQERDQRKLNQRLVGRQILQKQMMDKFDDQRDAKEQYTMEKQQVDAVLSKIIEDDRRIFENQYKKKKILFQDMQDALSDKEIKLQGEKLREQSENEKYLEFIKSKDNQARQIKQKKLDESEAKELIFLKLKEEEERRRKEQELLTDLRFELYREQFDAQEREKEKNSAKKRETFKYLMQQSEREAKEKKLREREEESKTENLFRDQMMLKFARDDKLEQMNQHKRFQKEVEHRREVERLWQEKIRQFCEGQQQERDEEGRKQETVKYQNQIIQEERQRILKEHIQNVGDFMPKGMVQTQEEFKMSRTNPNMNGRSTYHNTFKLS